MTTILLLTVSIATVSISHPSYASTTVRSGVVIPLYSYPDSTWTTIAQTAKAHPNVPIMVIINPSNGPGPSSDPVYLAAVQKLQSAGVTVLGYVDMLTGGGTLPAKTVPAAQSQVDEYHNWYAANGIFFDDFNNGFTYSPATYAALNTYVKALGMTYTMGNPGTSVSSGYIGTLDNLVIYESSGYPSLSSITYAGYPESNFALIAFGVSYSASFVTSAAPLVGYMYIDDLSGGNPYLSLTSLFSQTVTTLAAIDTQTTSSTTSSSSTAPTTTTTTSSTISSTTSASSPITIKVRSVNLLGVQLAGIYVTLKTPNGQVLAKGYTTFSYIGASGTTYVVCVFNYQTTVFTHWGSGSVNSCKTVTPTSNVVMTAFYG